MAKTVEPTAANGSDNRAAVHLTLQGKGWVGKSLIASVLAQYFREHGRDVRSIPRQVGDGIHAAFADGDR